MKYLYGLFVLWKERRMIDIKWIRDHPEALDHSLIRRGGIAQSKTLISMDISYRQAVSDLQSLQEERNSIAARMAGAKKTGEAVEPLIQAGTALKEKIAEAEEKTLGYKQALEDHLATLPNVLLDEVPTGQGEEDNVVEKTFLEPPSFDFTPKQHFELGEALDMMDFEQAAVIAGSRFVILKGELAQLERAIAQFMLDHHVEKFGYTEVSPPILVKTSALFGTGQLPKFGEDAFKTTDDRWLIPTSEVPLTNLGADQIFEEADLPLRYTAFTPCFRSEAGSAGRDTRGMIRLHQFSKVEMVSLVHPEHSLQELERMTKAAESILEALKLPYRRMTLCSRDVGPSAQKTYDLEVWLPGQGQYREISSCSVCGDFQARRMKARFKPQDKTAFSEKNPLVHTLNGSGLAVGRTLVAIMENYQTKDGIIEIPEILIPYMRGKEHIKKVEK